MNAIRDRLQDSSKPDVAVILATHNEVSVDKAVALVDKLGLGEKQTDGVVMLTSFVANRIAFAQLLGKLTRLSLEVVRYSDHHRHER